MKQGRILTQNIISKQIQMVKALLLMAKNADIKIAKTKLRDIFQAEDLITYTNNLTKTHSAYTKAPILKLYFLLIYKELYFNSENKKNIPLDTSTIIYIYNIEKKLKDFFIRQNQLILEMATLSIHEVKYMDALYLFASEFKALDGSKRPARKTVFGGSSFGVGDTPKKSKLASTNTGLRTTFTSSSDIIICETIINKINQIYKATVIYIYIYINI